MEENQKKERGLSARQQELVDQLMRLPTVKIDRDPVEILREMRRRGSFEAKVKYGKFGGRA